MSEIFTVGPGVAGRRLDLFLATAKGATRSQIQRLLKNGEVKVNGKIVRSSYVVETDDRVELDTFVEAELKIPIPKLPIIFEDDDVVIINKPAGMAVHVGNGRHTESTVADFARTISSDPDILRPGIVHRLDRETSGILVLAKTVAAKAALQAQWRTRKVSKRYLTLVIGHPEPSEAVIRLPLDKDRKHPTRRAVVASGREAVTRYKTIEDFDGYALVEVYPETGRTHQIRVHFAAIGHPVAGDTVYSASSRPLGLERQFLHAAGLKLTLPSGNKLDLSVDLPNDLVAILDQLRSTL